MRKFNATVVNVFDGTSTILMLKRTRDRRLFYSDGHNDHFNLQPGDVVVMEIEYSHGFVLKKYDAPIAQLDRASASEAEG